MLSHDQCMFVKRYRLKKRLGVLHHIVAGAGYDEPSVDREDGHDEGREVANGGSPDGADEWLTSETVRVWEDANIGITDRSNW